MSAPTGRRPARDRKGAALMLAALAPLSPLSPLSPARDDGAVRYTLAIDPAARSWVVTATFPHEQAGPLDVRFSRWTAGAYHLAEYGEFASGFAAHAPDGTALAARQEGSSHWIVDAGAAPEVVVAYRMRAVAEQDVNPDAHMILDVEASRITPEYAFVNPNAVFCWAEGLQDAPVELAATLPDGWQAATALVRRAAGIFVAPSFWRFEDSPLFFSADHRTIPFEVDGLPHEVTIYGRDEEEAQKIAAVCRKIVEAGRDWMQGLPYPRYHFLIGFVPESEDGGAGLEHGESTLILVAPGDTMDRELPHLIAHEYFHAWNAERIHVQALERPDYTQPLRTGTIWFNEGVTEYFCRHLLLRAGLIDRERFFQDAFQSRAEGNLMTQVMGVRADAPCTEVSRRTSEWKSMDDLLLFSLEHYQYGAWTAFALDLSMRKASGGERGLIDALRYLNRAYAQRGRGYGEEELCAIVSGIAQEPLDEFFSVYVDGPETPELKELLGVIGYTQRGGLKVIVPVKDPTREQLAALEDLFSLPPAVAGQ